MTASDDENLNAYLVNKSKMSDAALIAAIHGIYKQTMSKDDYYEILEMVQELYRRFVLPSLQKSTVGKQ